MQKKEYFCLIAGPYASGILATGPVAGAYYHHQPADALILEKVRQIQSICDAHDVPLQAAAVQFPLTHPAVASVVIGCATPEFVAKNKAFYHHPIPAALWEELAENKLIECYRNLTVSNV